MDTLAARSRGPSRGGAGRDTGADPGAASDRAGPAAPRRCAVLRRRLRAESCQYMDFERVTSTPERFFAALTSQTPFRWTSRRPGRSARPTRTPGSSVLLRRDHGGRRARPRSCSTRCSELAVFDTSRVCAACSPTRWRPSRPAATGSCSRRSTRRGRCGRCDDASDRFLVVQVPPVSAGAVAADLLQCRPAIGQARRRRPASSSRWPTAAPRTSRRSCGALAEPGLRVTRPRRGAGGAARAGRRDLDALPVQLRDPPASGPRLRRAQGASSASSRRRTAHLTEIAARVGRTPGSTKDYLGWLEDVDLVTAQRKRYTFAIRCCACGSGCTRGCDRRGREDRIADEVQRYTLAPPLGPDGLTLIRVGGRRQAVEAASARRAASRSASFLVRPSAAASTSPRTRTSTVNSRRCAGPVFGRDDVLRQRVARGAAAAPAAPTCGPRQSSRPRDMPASSSANSRTMNARAGSMPPSR